MKMGRHQLLLLCFGALASSFDINRQEDWCKHGGCPMRLGSQSNYQKPLDDITSGHVAASTFLNLTSTYKDFRGNHGTITELRETTIEIGEEGKEIAKTSLLLLAKGCQSLVEFETALVLNFEEEVTVEESAAIFVRAGEGKYYQKIDGGDFNDVGNVSYAGNGTVVPLGSSEMSVSAQSVMIIEMPHQQWINAVYFNGTEEYADRTYVTGTEITAMYVLNSTQTEDLQTLPPSDNLKMIFKDIESQSSSTAEKYFEYPFPGQDGPVFQSATTFYRTECCEYIFMSSGRGYEWFTEGNFTAIHWQNDWPSLFFNSLIQFI